METIIGAKSCTWQLKLTLWPTKPTIGSLVWCAAAAAVAAAAAAPRAHNYTAALSQLLIIKDLTSLYLGTAVISALLNAD